MRREPNPAGVIAAIIGIALIAGYVVPALFAVSLAGLNAAIAWIVK